MLTVCSRLATALSVIVLSTTALAQEEDRSPTHEERARFEQVLRALGFTSWEEVERDDGVWEVDDAATADGRKYDLRLDDAFAVIEREPDGVVEVGVATEVAGIQATSEPEQPILYVCSDGSRVQVLYPTSDLAMLMYKGEMIAMRVAVWGSGARYRGGGWQWWTKASQDGALSPLAAGEEVASAPGVDCRAG